MGLFGRKQAAPGTPSEPVSLGSVVLGDGSTYTINRLVDVLGDSCPRPQLMTKKALNEAASGDVIEVRVDNPTSMEAIPTVMAAVNGTYLDTLKADRYWRVFVRKN
ncbi:MAG TPA: sulfurtransferase TusA family protein [Acidiferrobacter sp.]|nr:sulfurtransferase TusA family protein [Acidiferrobacter sp.]